VGNYYTADASQNLFRDIGNIGITPVFFDKVHYCMSCGDYVERCAHDDDEVKAISGTEARMMLKSGKVPPAWFMRPDISQFLLDRIEAGEEVFV
jgi:sulfate adenylyltransferase